VPGSLAGGERSKCLRFKLAIFLCLSRIAPFQNPIVLRLHTFPAMVVFCLPGPRVPGVAFEVSHQGLQTAETNKLLCAQVLQAGPPVIGFDAIAPELQDQELLFVHGMRVVRPP
jgi:hypothetical protein